MSQLQSTQASLPWRNAVTKAAAKIIAKGLLADGIDIDRLTPLGRAELRAAIDKLLELIK
jgi:hypothetical protein